MVAATVEDGPNRAGNNQRYTQCFGLREDPIHPGGPRCSLSADKTGLTVREDC
jgi:hypothetical protein